MEVLALDRSRVAADEAVDAARRAALVDDDRLQAVYEVDEQEGTPFVVGAPVGGVSLGEYAAAGPLHPEQARAIIGEAAAALESARRHGVRHLALGPESIHVTDDGSVVVTGAGVANAVGENIDLSPAKASRHDAADLVRLLYLALTGQAPARGSRVPPPPPGALAQRVPHDLDDLCLRTLAEEAGPASPGDLLRSLAPWGDVDRPQVQGRSVPAATPSSTTAPAPSPAPAPSSRPRGRAAAGTAAGAAAAAAADTTAGGAAATAAGASTPRSSRPAPPPPPPAPAGETEELGAVDAPEVPVAAAPTSSLGSRLKRGKTPPTIQPTDQDATRSAGGAGAVAAASAGAATADAPAHGPEGDAASPGTAHPDTAGHDAADPAAPDHAETDPAVVDAAAAGVADTHPAAAYAAANRAAAGLAPFPPAGHHEQQVPTDQPDLRHGTRPGTHPDSHQQQPQHDGPSSDDPSHGGPAAPDHVAHGAGEPGTDPAQQGPESEPDPLAGIVPNRSAAIASALGRRIVGGTPAPARRARVGVPHLPVPDPYAEADAAQARERDDLSAVDPALAAPRHAPAHATPAAGTPTIATAQTRSRPPAPSPAPPGPPAPAQAPPERTSIARTHRPVRQQQAPARAAYESEDRPRGSLIDERILGREPTGRTIDPMPWIVGLFVVVLLLAGWWAVRTVASPTVPVDLSSETPPPIPSEEATTSDPTSGELGALPEPTLNTVELVDPEGGNTDNADTAALAADGDSSTYWRSLSYRDPAFGIKSGTGLIVWMDAISRVSGISIETFDGTAGGHVQIRIADPATPGEGTLLAEGELSDGVTEFTFDQPVATAHLIVWITELPVSGTDGANRAEISEISVS